MATHWKAVTPRGHVEPVRVIVIYENPRDLAPGFAARVWRVLPGVVSPGLLLCQGVTTIEQARALMPPGFVNAGTYPGDDPAIVEVWL